MWSSVKARRPCIQYRPHRNFNFEVIFEVISKPSFTAVLIQYRIQLCTGPICVRATQKKLSPCVNLDHHR